MILLRQSDPTFRTTESREQSTRWLSQDGPGDPARSYTLTNQSPYTLNDETYWDEYARYYSISRLFRPRLHFITVEMVERMLPGLGLKVVEIESTNYLIVVFSRS